MVGLMFSNPPVSLYHQFLLSPNMDSGLSRGFPLARERFTEFREIR